MSNNALSKQEKAIKAIQEIEDALVLWRSGKVTHEASMERINEIMRSTK